MHGAAGGGAPAAVLFTGLTDHDPGGALRYRIVGLDVALTGGPLYWLGPRVFQQIGGFAGAGGNDTLYGGCGADLMDGGADLFSIRNLNTAISTVPSWRRKR
ncbi:hypothetical protein [Azospirillum endophyticum]